MALILLSFFLIPAAQAADCQQLLSIAKKHQTKSSYVAESLMSPHWLPLDPSIAKAIKKHPISKLAQRLDSQSLGIDISPFPSNGYFVSTTIGENIQSLFLYKVLATLFPKSDINGTCRCRRWLSFRLRDSLEQREQNLSQIDSSYIDMPIIKAANASLKSVNRTKIRQQLGIPKSAKIATIYTDDITPDDFDIELFPSTQTLVKKLKALGYDHVILSPNPRSFSGLDEVTATGIKRQYPALSRLFKKTIIFSKLKKDQKMIAEKQSTLVINDTSGLLPYLYAASDLTVIQGPINPTESVSVGTPTVVFFNDEIGGGYDEEGYYKIVSYLQKTGRGALISKLSELDAAVENLESGKKSSLDPDEVKVNGKTSLETFLDVLEKKIREQIRRR